MHIDYITFIALLYIIIFYTYIHLSANLTWGRLFNNPGKEVDYFIYSENGSIVNF